MTKENFKILFDKYFDSIRSFIYYRSGDIELSTDISQDVFMKLWEKQFEFEQKKIKSLLYKIANEMFITYYRKEKLKLNFANSIKTNSLEQSPEEQTQYEELNELYEKSLKELPEKQRIVFLMNRNEDLKYREIAKRLNISIKAVEKRMKLALAYLRLKIKSNY